jgi:tRNA(His) 5'-end guanylyltransferase
MKMYEEVTRGKLPPRTYTLMRVDGRSFHTFTKKFKRPFDDDFVNMMNQSAIALCSEVQGAKIGYVQSDEISVIMTDFDDINTIPWFDGVVSVSKIPTYQVVN